MTQAGPTGTLFTCRSYKYCMHSALFTRSSIFVHLQHYTFAGSTCRCIVAGGCTDIDRACTAFVFYCRGVISYTLLKFYRRCSLLPGALPLSSMPCYLLHATAQCTTPGSGAPPFPCGTNCCMLLFHALHQAVVLHQHLVVGAGHPSAAAPAQAAAPAGSGGSTLGSPIGYQAHGLFHYPLIQRSTISPIIQISTYTISLRCPYTVPYYYRSSYSYMYCSTS